MTYPKYVVLSALEEAGPLTVKELSARAAMESSTLSPLLKRMAEYGTLTRERAPEDERRVVVQLTDMGREAVAMVHASVLGSLKGLDFDPSQTGAIVKALNAARTKVESAEPAHKLIAGGMPPPLPNC